MYDSDESLFHFTANEETQIILNVNGIACDYIFSKFQEHLLFKLTNHIVNKLSAISTSRIRNTTENNNNDTAYLLKKLNSIDGSVQQDDEQSELAQVDQIKFDKLVSLYRQNLDYFACARMKFSNEIIQETQYILLEFLTMLNNWKLRNFNSKIQSFKNSRRSEFIEAILNVLKAYECVISEPNDALNFCKIAYNSIKKFNELFNLYGNDNHLIEKFKLLIVDWILSAQTLLWSKHKIHDVNLFNETLKVFKELIQDYPELVFKVRMYETVLMYLSNRNPIHLINPTSRQIIFANSNQEAFCTMNTILKKFNLNIVD